MRAWTYTKAGRNLATALTLNPNVRRPSAHPPPADKLLVRVTHMSPNPADYKLPEASRLATLLATRSLTATPGMDYAGIVEAVGPSSSPSTYKPGDPVFGTISPTQHGTLSEYILASTLQNTGSSCVPLPPTLSPLEASTLGTTAQAAYQALTTYTTLSPGDEVFINGGSGGVGTYAIQIAARALGCVVTTSCSTGNIALCESLGASTVLDYTTSSITESLRASGPNKYRLVLDNVGSSPSDIYAQAHSYLRADGVYVQLGGGFGVADLGAAADRALRPAFLGGGRRAYRFHVLKSKCEDLVRLAGWLRDGTIRAVVDGEAYPFEEAPRAFEKLRTGRVRGNLVVKVSD